MTSNEDNQENIPLKTEREPKTTNLNKSSNSIDHSGQNSGNKSKLNGALSLFAILFWGLAGYAVFLQLKVLRQANQLISQGRISKSKMMQLTLLKAQEDIFPKKYRFNFSKFLFFGWCKHTIYHYF